MQPQRGFFLEIKSNHFKDIHRAIKKMWIAGRFPVDNFLFFSLASRIMPRGGYRPGAGRKKGSTNKNLFLSGATVLNICEKEKFHPVQKLARIANGTDTDEEWTSQQKLQATLALVGAIQKDQAIKVGQDIDDSESGQYEIVYVTEPADIGVQGTPDAGGDPGAVRTEPL